MDALCTRKQQNRFSSLTGVKGGPLAAELHVLWVLCETPPR